MWKIHRGILTKPTADVVIPMSHDHFHDKVAGRDKLRVFCFIWIYSIPNKFKAHVHIQLR